MQRAVPRFKDQIGANCWCLAVIQMRDMGTVGLNNGMMIGYKLYVVVGLVAVGLEDSALMGIGSRRVWLLLGWESGY
jgi:hypothetical protein